MLWFGLGNFVYKYTNQSSKYRKVLMYPINSFYLFYHSRTVHSLQSNSTLYNKRLFVIQGKSSYFCIFPDWVRLVPGNCPHLSLFPFLFFISLFSPYLSLSLLLSHIFLTLSLVKYAWYTADRDLNSRKCLRGPHRTSSNLYC